MGFFDGINGFNHEEDQARQLFLKLKSFADKATFLNRLETYEEAYKQAINNHRKHNPAVMGRDSLGEMEQRITNLEKNKCETCDHNISVACDKYGCLQDNDGFNIIETMDNRYKEQQNETVTILKAIEDLSKRTEVIEKRVLPRADDVKVNQNPFIRQCKDELSKRIIEEETSVNFTLDDIILMANAGECIVWTAKCNKLTGVIGKGETPESALYDLRIKTMSQKEYTDLSMPK